ncbi:MAG: hypothetical protein ACYTGX_19570, partial [Planctomycetota bacterium]
MRGLRLALLCVLLFASVGCATIPNPPSEALRSKFGRIGVRVVEARHVAFIDPPTVGGGGGFALGFVRGVGFFPVWVLGGAGAAASAGGAGGPAAILVIPLGALLGAAWGVLYVPISAIAGGVTAETLERFEEAQPVIEREMRAMKFGEGLAQAVMQR